MPSEKYTQLMAEIAKSKEEIAKIQKDVKDKIQNNFTGLTNELFNIYPELKSFGWRQYTPYFNDGESCEFSSRHDNPIINGADEDYGDEPEEGVINIVRDSSETYRDSSTDWKNVPNPNYNPYYKEIVTSVKNFLNQFDNDDMYDLFGDHVKVTITAEGAKTSEYDHD